MKFTLHKDKVTPGTIRFSSGRDPEHPEDPHTKNIYLKKSEVEELGNPESIEVTIEPVK